MGKHTPTITQVNEAHYFCNRAAQLAYAAMWADDSRYFLLQELGDQFEKAAFALGFTLTPITEALPTEPPAPRDPDSGRPSLVEPAATSELFGNFGG